MASLFFTLVWVILSCGGGAVTTLHAQSAQRSAPAKVTPTHYNIDVAFEPEKNFLRATAAVTLQINEPAESIEFELNRHLTLRSVTDPQGRALDFVRSGRLGSHKLLVRLAEPPPAGAALTLTFTYDGALPPASLDYITPDGILLRDESRWYPATDLSAFTTIQAKIDLPSGWSTYLADESGSKDVRWASQTIERDGALSSRALVAIPSNFWPCSICSLYYPPEVDPFQISCASYCTLDSDPAREPDFVGSFWQIQKVYRDILGTEEDPFGQMFYVAAGFPGQRDVIGYSAPGFLVVSEDVVKWHGHLGFAPEFLPHEIAHQWFPIEVTLRSEEDGWLAESLAEYLAWRYLEEKQPDDARRMVERAMRNTLAEQPLRPLRFGLKLFALEPWDVTHATLYQRGMLVWRTLETVIDRERVDRSLREYYRRYRGGPASIADFRRICEEISGRDLGWFFDYYINGTNLPAVTLRRLPSAAPNELAGEIHIANAPPGFQVRVEMRIVTRDGVIEHSVATRGPVTPFALDVRAPVVSVELDPKLRILRVTEAGRRHRAQLEALHAAAITEEAGSDADSLRALIAVYQSAIALDPENLAANQQLYHLQIGRLQFRLKDYDAAWESLERALALESLDPMATDLHRAWARVFRARIALARGDCAAAQREAEAGLVLKSPALETPLVWPDAPQQPTTASAALKALLKTP